MFETYFLPIIIFVVIGLLAGILLAVVSSALSVKEDETAAKVREALPGANCGACGYSSCDDYAENIALHSAPINKCVPGGEKTAAELSKIMGTEAGEVNKRVAFVRCNGNHGATDTKYDYYNGVMTCAAVKNIYSGNGSCNYGCMGFGDCEQTCEYDAVHVVNGVSVVDPQKCVGCSKCAAVCPAGLISMIQADKRVNVACSSHAPGKTARAACKNGCIACRRCEKTCRFDAIHVVNNLAAIDYEKCTDCGECAEVCPVKCIAVKDVK